MKPNNSFATETRASQHVRQNVWFDAVCSRLQDSGSNDAQFHDAGELAAWMTHYFSSSRDTCRRINRDYALRKKLVEQAASLSNKAYARKDQAALAAVTAVLEIIYRHDFSLRKVELIDSDVSPIARDVASIIEEDYLNSYLDHSGPALIAEYPKGGKDFVRWFKDTIQNHVSSNHVFYEDFLPNHAKREHLRFYLAQETNLDPRFDDILAQIQVGHHGAPKMEIASNYWDEMGNGKSEEVHTNLFQKTLDYLDVDAEYIRNNVFHESVASGNMSSCLAIYRRHNLRALGYFGTTEYIAPKRFKSLLKAWERNELDPLFAQYHRLHVSIDAAHGAAWLNNVIAPLVESNPACGRAIAEGMLLRLESSNDYLDALQKRVVAL
jgi:hypothetical protein